MDDYQHFIALSRYARWIDTLGRRETWPETVTRYVDFFTSKYPDYPRDMIYDAIVNLAVMPSMRAMMMAGKALDKCNVGAYNCSYIVVDNQRAFDEALYILMSGTGVGFSVERQYVNKLPAVPEALYATDTTIIVDDSRIGWAKALKELIALLYTGQVAKWDVSKVRPAGARLVTTGGRASGPQPLVDLFEFVIKTFRKAQGRKLNSLECHDIMCMIGDIVVTGGVRRSALISLSNLSDDRMRNAKNGTWWEHEPQRALGNNSVAYTEKPDMQMFMKEWLTLKESGSGERGLFNRVAAAKKAQENERRDARGVEYGTNPCQPGFATVVHKEKGVISFYELQMGDEILSSEGWTKVVNKWATGVKPVYVYTFYDTENVFIGTDNHRVVTRDRGKLEIEKVFNGFNLVEMQDGAACSVNRKICIGNHEVFDITVDNETHTYYTDGVNVSNCGEIILRPNQFCNLSEVVVRETSTLEELKESVRIATIIGTYQAALTDFKYLRPIWKRNCEEERLLGVSLTGIQDHPVLGKLEVDALGFKNVQEGLLEMKQVAIDTNKVWTAKLGINQSVAITTVKPSGCQKPDTMVSTKDGILKLCELGDPKGATWQELTKFVLDENHTHKEATRFYNNGVARTLKIKMKSGLTLECTPNHKYKVLGDAGSLIWQAASDISVGTVIPYGVNVDKSSRPYQTLRCVSTPRPNCQNNVKDDIVYLDEDVAWFLGLYFGDGSNHRAGIRISGSLDHIDRLERASSILEEKLGLKSKLLYSGKKNADLYINSTHVLHWLAVNEVSKQKSANVEIPLLIRKSSNAVIDAFISGYCAADGVENHLGRAIVTTSKTMAEQLVVAFRFIGKDASMREMPPTKSSWGKKMRYWVQEKKGLTGNTKSLAAHVQADISRLKQCAPNAALLPDYVVEISEGHGLTLDIEVPDGHAYMANSYISHNTVSQLVDSASGIHPRFSKYYIRRVRSDSKNPITTFMKDSGVPTEVDVMNPNALVFSFPQKAPDSATVVDDISAIQQLEHYLIFRRYWCEHNPSITVYMREDEWMEVGAWVYKHFDELGGVSFLPKTDHVYKQAPYQAIGVTEYNTLKATMPKIDWSQLHLYEQNDSTINVKELACVSGVCEL